MRKGLSAFNLVPQRSKHHSAHKKPLSPKNPCHNMHKKGGHDAYPLNHELQIQNRNSKTWTMCSKFVPSDPILNRELQFWTLTSTGATSKFTKMSKLHRTVQNESRQCRNRLFIFYYILTYIICILFLLYIILYYMYFIFIIYYFILYVLP